jgi:hypothetical protein
MGALEKMRCFQGSRPYPLGPLPTWEEGLQSEGQIQDSLYWTRRFPRLVFGRIGFRCTRTGGAI